MKKVSMLLVMAFTLLAFSGFAFAFSPQLEGRPVMFQPRETRGYFIWHNENGLHIKTTTRGLRHVFSGEIRTDGKFVNVNGERLESNDKIKINRDHNRIDFKYITGGEVDGINIRLLNARNVHFDLFIDGHEIDPREIYVGHNGWHPDYNSFTLYR